MGFGRGIGKIANSLNNLVMGAANSRATRTIVGGASRAINRSAEPLAGVAEGAIKGAQKAVGAATKKETYQKIGKAVEKGADKVTRNVLTDPDAYKQIGKVPFGNSKGTPILTANKTLFADDMQRRLQTSLNTVAGVSSGLVKSGGDNLLHFGMKATGLGVVAATTFQVGAGTPQAVKQWNKSRQGSNYDSQPVTSAPKVPAYAQNGGATGDLVFALNNLRHGGMM